MKLNTRRSAIWFIGLLIVQCILCQAQTRPSTSNSKGTSEVTRFVGCYELNMGRWWPWGFGEDTEYATPANRIQLLPDRGTEGFEKYGYVLRALPATQRTLHGRFGPAYWVIQSDNHIDLIWNDGFTGVTLRVDKEGDDLRGWAHPHFDTPTIPRIARVTGRKVPCERQ